ncbi:translation initiation factor IF-2 [Pongo abelii]|uniref:translation initiation factor IF-2 n=1 Tax=Pongo abelii TaxID=9601 RepID=UPI0030072A1D
MATPRAPKAGTAAPSAPRPPPRALPGCGWTRLRGARGARLPSRGSPGTTRRAPREPAPLAPVLWSDPGQPLAACSGPLGEPRADPGVSTRCAATMIPRGKRTGGRSCGSSPRMGRGERAELSFPAAAPRLKRGFGFWFFFCGNSSVEILLACHTTHPF